MIFSELYGAYYAAVAEIIRLAVRGELDDKSMIEAINSRAFKESVAEIQRPLKDGRWQLIKKDFSTPIKHEPDLPVTLLEKRWLKAISYDKRIKLFGVELGLPDVEPLFDISDVEAFDRYGDGDDFENPVYIKNFRLILNAVNSGQALQIDIPDRNGRLMRIRVKPERLEYSEKDDKFRLYVKDNAVKAVNLAKIISVKIYNGQNFRKYSGVNSKQCAILEITDDRNALERCMLHFAHFKKEVKKIGENTYLAKIYYDKNDESEMVIRVLSFDPFVKATGGSEFVNLIKERLQKQIKLWT